MRKLLSCLLVMVVIAVSALSVPSMRVNACSLCADSSIAYVI